MKGHLTHHIIKLVIICFGVVLTTLTLVSCDRSYRSLSENRKQVNENAKGDILIGVVSSDGNSGMFTDGIDLAAAEINEGGGIFGRKIRLLKFDDQGSVVKAQKIARKLVHNLDVVAVIGHVHSEVALAVGMIYEYGGVLFLSPGATDPRLTHQKDGKYVFRNIPDDDVIIHNIVNYCTQKKINRFAVIYDRKEDMLRQAKIFSEFAKSAGIDIVATRSYFQWQDDYQIMASELIHNNKFDAVFLAGQLPSAGKVIEQMRELGCETPFFCMPSMDSPELGGIIGREAEGTIVPTVFDPKRLSKNTREFVDRFQAKYDLPPDTMAAQGYDALSVIAYAIQKKGSSVPIVVASALHFLTDWQGVVGKYSFTLNGDVTGSTIYFKKFVNGRFEYMPRRHKEEVLDPNYVIEDISLRIPIKRDVPTIDPGIADMMESNEIITQLFIGLTDFNLKTFEPIPALAIDWNESDDGKIFRFHLRKDLKWTDNTPVTAHDVVWTVIRNLSPQVKNPLAEMLLVLKNAQAFHDQKINDPALVGVHAIDDYTVEFSLTHRVAYFTSLTALNAFRPLPRKVIEKYPQNWTDPDKIVTNGPYKLWFWQKGKRIVLKKNPLYYDAKNVSIPEIHYFIIPEESVGLAMYENGELDVMGGGYLNIPVSSIEEIKRNPNLAKQYSTWPQIRTYAYCFNTRREPVDNPLVRKAIASVIDRKLVTSLVMRTGNTPALTFVHPLVTGAPSPHSGGGIPFNPEKARQWLSQAGYPDGRNMPELDLLCIKSDLNRSLAEAVSEFVSYYLNIKIHIIEVSETEYIANIRSDNTAHLFMLDWVADYPDANNFLKDLFQPGQPPNLCKWSNPEFAKLTDEAEQSVSLEHRKSLYLDADTILCQQQVGVIPVFYGSSHVLIKPRVKGWTFSPFAGQHLKKWRLEK